MYTKQFLYKCYISLIFHFTNTNLYSGCHSDLDIQETHKIFRSRVLPRTYYAPRSLQSEEKLPQGETVYHKVSILLVHQQAWIREGNCGITVPDLI